MYGACMTNTCSKPEMVQLAFKVTVFMNISFHNKTIALSSCWVVKSVNGSLVSTITFDILQQWKKFNIEQFQNSVYETENNR